MLTFLDAANLVSNVADYRIDEHNMNSQSGKNSIHRVVMAGLLALVSAAALGAPGGRDHDRDRDRDRPSWKPDTIFMQAGNGDQSTSAYAVGAAWNWNWSRQYRIGLLTGYTEATVGRWHTDSAALTDAHWFTQVGITPVFRLFPGGGENRWFGEVGIGANYISPIYRTESKRFSTAFNFGDHAAVGRILGDRRQASVALRLQHFSNGGIDEPNPGENFTQLRYSYQF
jgi:hypothetical protein